MISPPVPAKPPLVPAQRVIGFAQMYRVKGDGQDVWVMTREELMQFAGKIVAAARELPAGYPVCAANSLKTDRRIPWRELDIAGAWIDAGSLVAIIPYLNVRRLSPPRTMHQIFSQRPGARPELRDGVWWWV